MANLNIHYQFSVNNELRCYNVCFDEQSFKLLAEAIINPPEWVLLN